MKSGYLIPFCLFFIIACSISPTATSQSYDSNTFAPEETVVNVVNQDQWFFEHFDRGMPLNWVASPGWTSGQSTILSIQPEQTFRVPSEWYDLEIYARLQQGTEGWSSIGFRNKHDNYYQLSFNQSQLILGKHGASQYHGKQLSAYELTYYSGWHEVVISLISNRILVKWDGELVIDYKDDDPLVSGDIFIQNWDSSLYELDFLQVSPPDHDMVMATAQSLVTETINPTSTVKQSTFIPTDTEEVIINPKPITPAITPTNTTTTSGSSSRGGCSSTFDLGVTSVYLNDRGFVMMDVVNLGPAGYSGSIYTYCTIWYGAPSFLGYGESNAFSAMLEPGQSVLLELNCRIDNSLGPLVGANAGVQDNACDPNPTNNYSNF